MQKAKKMSKQTLVIAVLAVLLVLSLALSVTGAWFTDVDDKTSTTDIQFATVAIDAPTLDSSYTLSGSRTKDDILPGDTISLAGSVATASSVKIYVGVVLSDVTVMGSDDSKATFEHDLTTICGSDIAVSFATGTITAATVLDQDEYATMLVYTVEANATGSIAYTGSVEFKNTLENAYTVGTTRYILNNNGMEAEDGITDVIITDARIEATVDVAAVQFDNITEGEALDKLAELCGLAVVGA